MTVLKRLWLTCKLKITVKHGKSASQKQDWKEYFQGHKMTVLIENNIQDACDSQHLKFMYCSLFEMVLNSVY